ncbi:MAG: MAC/perforin domain-containing protein, partial [Pseudomonadales bacterium]|nr:MAC/perforin domain-containing protein [Pseudomonadales bacterium]
MNILARLRLCAFVLAAACCGTAAAEEARIVPGSIFAGCDDGAAAPEARSEDPRARMATRTVDRVTQRSFASFTIDDVERGVPEDMRALCWARLDGVWRELSSIVLDRKAGEQYREIWGSDKPDRLNIAHGRYETPRHLVVVDSADPERAIYLATGIEQSPFVKFESTDGIPLTDVLRRSGARKVYSATRPFAYGARLVLDVSATGSLRMELGGRMFMRPRPGISDAAMAGQLPANDAFLLSYNLEGLAASRRGYDVLTQDPFYLRINPKLEVFAEVSPQNYYITEKRTVPVGFTLVPSGIQGMVYRKSLVSSASDIQETTSTTFGFDLGGETATGTGFSVAFSSTESASRGLSESQSVAEAVAYSRHKQYALVVDHPYITLSKLFIDAVGDARRLHRYQRLIDNFGTHYAYAVTYGAAARLTQRIDEQTYATRIGEQSSFATAAGATYYGFGGSAHYSQMEGRTTGESGTIGSEGATFDAVGGNGSWNEQGYSAGSTPYPILLDLRPIWELLNPMNFPGEPEIYVTVRQNLERAVKHYLASNAPPLTDDAPIDGIEPIAPPKAEPVQVWRAYVKRIWCTGGGSGLVKGVRTPELTISARDNTTTKTTGQRNRKNDLDVSCKRREEKESLTYEAGDPGLLTIRGTADEIRNTIVKFDQTWEYHQGP